MHGVLFRQRWGAWGIICRCFLGARGGVAALRKPRAPFLFPFPKFQFLTMFVPPPQKNSCRLYVRYVSCKKLVYPPCLSHASETTTFFSFCGRRLQLLFNLETFYRESLNAESLFAIDLSSVARAASPDGIRALVQLLVGAAVSCGGKADYIQAIMQVSSIALILLLLLLLLSLLLCCVYIFVMNS